jgi:mannose-6-phosphate isomerase-like protein (cupin superfamily)
MRLLIALALAALPCGVQAQAVYATKADIAAAALRAKVAIQPGHGSAGTPLIVLGGYMAKLEYHVGPNIANAHDGQDELFQAVEGSGTLVTGGTIVKTGATAIITGGSARPVAAGDVFIVPQGTPHWFSQVDGHMILISVMLPAK